MSDFDSRDRGGRGGGRDKDKANMPEYEIQPTEGARTRPTQREGAESGSGPRVWNVLKF